MVWPKGRTNPWQNILVGGESLRQLVHQIYAYETNNSYGARVLALKVPHKLVNWMQATYGYPMALLNYCLIQGLDSFRDKDRDLTVISDSADFELKEFLQLDVKHRLIAIRIGLTAIKMLEPDEDIDVLGYKPPKGFKDKRLRHNRDK